MNRPLERLSACVIVALAFPVAGSAAPYFERLTSFPVADNLPRGSEPLTETSAEIVAVTGDGMRLVYTDSPLGGIGFVDIRDPAAPAPGGFLALDGEPTSVTVRGKRAYVAVDTSDSYTEPSGRLVPIDVDTRELGTSCELGGQPDSIALSKDGAHLAIAIENERDEDLDDGAMPQLPGGEVVLFDVVDGEPACDSMTRVALDGLADIAPDDPEPEFVDFNDAGMLVVTLQENDHLAVIDAAAGELVADFSAGSVDLEGIDTEEDGALRFDSSQPSRLREPDAVKWLDDERFVIANEGDLDGGSRGFTIFSKAGEMLHESGTDFEYRAIRAGHYPEGRSDNKGIEPEGLEVATFGGETFIFVLAERASLVGVYRDTGAAPEFVQLLPTGLAPEGAVAIPSRGLLAVAAEADLGEDGGPRSQVTLYRLGEHDLPAYPTIVSADVDGRPLGWGALSGLFADPAVKGRLHAVDDGFYAMQPRIFTIDANVRPAVIDAAIDVTRDGQPAQLLDLEGITGDGEGGWWVASEGRRDRLVAHAVLHVDADGAIDRTIAFPDEVAGFETRYGAEGITRVGDTLWVALQRPWRDDAENTVKLLALNVDDETWRAVAYPLDSGEGRVGLSEIVAHDGWLYVIERDDGVGAKAAIKRIQRVALEGLDPVALGETLPVVAKELVRDLLPDLAATGGQVLDKVEGLAIDVSGTAWVVTDNDGVDDSNGETLFLPLGPIDERAAGAGDGDS